MRWLLTWFMIVVCVTPLAAADRPHILWISAEDISPDLGCYADPYALSPNIDKFAAEGVRFTRCFTHAGVCAPSRSGLITGMYPPSLGTQHMRSKGVPPVGVKCFPEYLRAAGYYCTNNVKTDYQFDAPVTAWDEQSNKADWRGRQPDQPFFSVINFTTTHESQVRDPSDLTQKLVAELPAEMRHNPAKAVVPPYYPDTPVIRKDLANYADNITAMDGQFAEVLKKLEDDGLAEDTIVWFWGDHGRGLSRSKRWLYDSGTHVPLIIRVPEKWRAWASQGMPDRLAAGKTYEDLVAFVDFAPTMLSLAGVELPGYLKGQAFLGPKSSTTPREYVHGHRDRMDETYDLIRMVRDQRFKYLRNFMADVSYGQDITYMNEMPMMQEMRRLHAENKLSGGPAQYFRPTKPVEELFDTVKDPHELNNLAKDPQYADVLKRLRAECERWMLDIQDTGLIPEPIFDEYKRPLGQYQTAVPPTVLFGPEHNGVMTAELQPRRPGGSFAYAVLPTDARDLVKPRWQLYTGAITGLKPGTTLLTKTCELGLKDSPEVRRVVGQPSRENWTMSAIPHWRDVVVKSGQLPRLLKLKSYDAQPAEIAQPVYQASLTDEAPAVRYWALRGLILLARTPEQRQSLTPELQKYRSDSEIAIQILAAKSLAEWNHDATQLEFLASTMANDRQDSVRLAATIALRDLGEFARPMLPQLKEASKGGEYVGRVSQAAVRQLEASKN